MAVKKTTQPIQPKKVEVKKVNAEPTAPTNVEPKPDVVKEKQYTKEYVNTDEFKALPLDKQVKILKQIQGASAKRGRPVNPDSDRQKRLREQAERAKANGGEVKRGRPADPNSDRQKRLREQAEKLLGTTLNNDK